MYDWVDGTWNPLAGECFHGCAYCSTKKLRRFSIVDKKYAGEPRIDEQAMRKHLGKDKTWFVCGQNDLFAENVPVWVIRTIMEKCRQYDNLYIFQTKNPARVAEFSSYFPNKRVLCVTIETNRFVPEVMMKSPTPWERVDAIEALIEDFAIYITVEPIMAFDVETFLHMLMLCEPDQVNIGANTYAKVKLPEPSKEEIEALIVGLQRFTTVKEKKNLERLLK